MSRTRRLTAALAIALVAALGGPGPGGAQAQPAPTGGAEAALTGVTQVSAGGSHTCARLTGGRVRCWGADGFGQLGTGEVGVDHLSPVLVRNTDDTGDLTDIRQVSAGYEHTCALLATGRVLCWGRNDDGELGDGTTDDRALPVFVRNPADTGPLTGVRRIVAGSADHTCAVLDNGEVRCWGSDEDGQLGDGRAVSSSLPVAVKAPAGQGSRLRGVRAVELGTSHTCALLRSGVVRCWGLGADGRLGHGTSLGSRRPVVVRGPDGSTGALDGVTTLGVGDDTSCARTFDGRAWCWGRGADGSRGDGTFVVAAARPRGVRSLAGAGALNGVEALSGGNESECAHLTDGQARCWGRGGRGQLGNGGTVDRNRPRIVGNVTGTGPLTRVAQLSSGDDHSCAVLTTGQLRCWGDNGSGQLGNGTSGTIEARPVRVLVV